MGLSAKTTNKLRAESEELGGKVYADGEDSVEEDVTHLEEDDDPLRNAGDLIDENSNSDDSAPVGEVPDEGQENS